MGRRGKTIKNTRRTRRGRKNINYEQDSSIENSSISMELEKDSDSENGRGEEENDALSSEEISNLDSNSDINTKYLTKRQIYTLKKKNDKNFQDNICIPNLSNLKKKKKKQTLSKEELAIKKKEMEIKRKQHMKNVQEQKKLTAISRILNVT